MARICGPESIVKKYKEIADSTESGHNTIQQIIDLFRGRAYVIQRALMRLAEVLDVPPMREAMLDMIEALAEKAQTSPQVRSALSAALQGRKFTITEVNELRNALKGEFHEIPLSDIGGDRIESRLDRSLVQIINEKLKKSNIDIEGTRIPKIIEELKKGDIRSLTETIREYMDNVAQIDSRIANVIANKIDDIFSSIKKIFDVDYKGYVPGTITKKLIIELLTYGTASPEEIRSFVTTAQLGDRLVKVLAETFVDTILNLTGNPRKVVSTILASDILKTQQGQRFVRDAGGYAPVRAKLEEAIDLVLQHIEVRDRMTPDAITNLIYKVFKGIRNNFYVSKLPAFKWLGPIIKKAGLPGMFSSAKADVSERRLAYEALNRAFHYVPGDLRKGLYDILDKLDLNTEIEDLEKFLELGGKDFANRFRAAITTREVREVQAGDIKQLVPFSMFSRSLFGIFPKNIIEGAYEKFIKHLVEVKNSGKVTMRGAMGEKVEVFDPGAATDYVLAAANQISRNAIMFAEAYKSLMGKTRSVERLASVADSILDALSDLVEKKIIDSGDTVRADRVALSTYEMAAATKNILSFVKDSELEELLEVMKKLAPKYVHPVLLNIKELRAIHSEARNISEFPFSQVAIAEASAKRLYTHFGAEILGAVIKHIDEEFGISGDNTILSHIYDLALKKYFGGEDQEAIKRVVQVYRDISNLRDDDLSKVIIKDDDVEKEITKLIEYYGPTRVRELLPRKLLDYLFSSKLALEKEQKEKAKLEKTITGIRYSSISNHVGKMIKKILPSASKDTISRIFTLLIPSDDEKSLSLIEDLAKRLEVPAYIAVDSKKIVNNFSYSLTNTSDLISMMNALKLLTEPVKGSSSLFDYLVENHLKNKKISSADGKLVPLSEEKIASYREEFGKIIQTYKDIHKYLLSRKDDINNFVRLFIKTSYLLDIYGEPITNQSIINALKAVPHEILEDVVKYKTAVKGLIGEDTAMFQGKEQEAAMFYLIRRLTKHVEDVEEKVYATPEEALSKALAMTTEEAANIIRAEISALPAKSIASALPESLADMIDLDSTSITALLGFLKQEDLTAPMLKVAREGVPPSLADVLKRFGIVPKEGITLDDFYRELTSIGDVKKYIEEKLSKAYALDPYFVNKTNEILVNKDSMIPLNVDEGAGRAYAILDDEGNTKIALKLDPDAPDLPTVLRALEILGVKPESAGEVKVTVAPVSKVSEETIASLEKSGISALGLASALRENKKFFDVIKNYLSSRKEPDMSEIIGIFRTTIKGKIMVRDNVIAEGMSIRELLNRLKDAVPANGLEEFIRKVKIEKAAKDEAPDGLTESIVKAICNNE